ncbi:hypothetical protein BGX33_012605 [Mortierella sp. NVP41]|nr:hypothetical protein BGX33_012605 [Mortierella sp. NVP41]
MCHLDPAVLPLHLAVLDWNRPFFFARSKSGRCPPTLQSNVRALPSYDQLTASIVTTGVLRAGADSEMAAMTGRARSRGLRNRDGSAFRPTPEQELHTAEIRVTWRQVKEDYVEDDDDPVVAIARPCLSAQPLARGRFGFVEYEDDGEKDEVQEQDCRTGGIVTFSTSSGQYDTDEIVESSRPILDVNDTSAMVAAGIDPSEPHPNPEAFYSLHHPQAGALTDSQANTHNEQLVTTMDMNTQGYSHYHSCTADVPAADPTFLQSIRTVLTKTGQPIVTCVQQTRNKSRVVRKWIWKPMKRAFSGQDSSVRRRSSQCNAATRERFDTVTEIQRAGPGMDHRLAHLETISSMTRDEWLHQLPGGRAAAGRFDREWLDAMPELPVQ